MRGWLSDTRRRRMIVATAAMLAGACVTAPAAGEVDSISLETGPCFGACPVYRVTVNRDGNGLFEGRRFTAVTGERRFSVTPAQYRALVSHLAPLRPPSGERRYSGEACESMATDLPSVEVEWRALELQRLYFYYGCDMERNRAIAERLSAAPDLLPIGDFIGPNR